MGDLTNNFDRKEFACKCGCGLDSIDLGIVNRLQVVRDIVNLPIKVHSGCRCEKHNKDEGGEKDSYHLFKNGCKAIDWDIEEGEKTLERACVNLLPNWSGGFHYYPLHDKKYVTSDSFCHSDVGPKRRW